MANTTACSPGSLYFGRMIPKFAGVGVIRMRELKVFSRWLAHSDCFCKMNLKLTLLTKFLSTSAVCSATQLER